MNAPTKTQQSRDRQGADTNTTPPAVPHTPDHHHPRNASFQGTACLVAGFMTLAAVALSNTAPASEPEGPTAPRVTVALVLLEEPSCNFDTCQDPCPPGSCQVPCELETDTPYALARAISAPSQLSVGQKIYLEAWCQAPGPNGITTAVVDIAYDTTYFDTTNAQVKLSCQWETLPFGVFVDDAAGRVENLGGNNFNAPGVAPLWAKIGTIELDVIEVPAVSVQWCSLFAGLSGGGFPLEFGIQGEGSVDPVDVDYGCLTAGCNADLDSFNWFFACMTGPGLISSNACACADADADLDVDFNDFGTFQVSFNELWCCTVPPPTQ